MADPLCFKDLCPEALASFLGTAPRLSNPVALRKVRCDLPIYLFSGSEDPVGQQLRGVHLLIDRYRDAGLRNIACDFYPAGRHEMLNEINRLTSRPTCSAGSRSWWKNWTETEVTFQSCPNFSTKEN